MCFDLRGYEHAFYPTLAARNQSRAELAWRPFNQSSRVSLVLRIATATKLVRRCLSCGAEASQNVRVDAHKHRLQQYWSSPPQGYAPRGCLRTLARALSTTSSSIISN